MSVFVSRFAGLSVLFSMIFVAWAVPLQADPAPIEKVMIRTEKGEFSFRTEIAKSLEHRTRGLMFRHRLPKDKAMLFDYGKPRMVSMWMKNTIIPLDMIFIHPDGSVATITKNTTPQSLALISSKVPVAGVLEVAAGTVERIGLKPGDKVFHRIFGK